VTRLSDQLRFVASSVKQLAGDNSCGAVSVPCTNAAYALDEILYLCGQADESMGAGEDGTLIHPSDVREILTRYE